MSIAAVDAVADPAFDLTWDVESKYSSEKMPLSAWAIMKLTTSWMNPPDAKRRGVRDLGTLSQSLESIDLFATEKNSTSSLRKIAGAIVSIFAQAIFGAAGISYHSVEAIRHLLAAPITLNSSHLYKTKDHALALAGDCLALAWSALMVARPLGFVPFIFCPIVTFFEPWESGTFFVSGLKADDCKIAFNARKYLGLSREDGDLLSADYEKDFAYFHMKYQKEKEDATKLLNELQSKCPAFIAYTLYLDNPSLLLNQIQPKLSPTDYTYYEKELLKSVDHMKRINQVIYGNEYGYIYTPKFSFV